MLHRLYVDPGAPPHPPVLHLGDETVEIVDDAKARLASGVGRPKGLKVVDLAAASVAATPAGSGPTLVYADRFSGRDLQQLRQRGWCGLDRAGQLVFSSPETVVVIERPRAKATSRRGSSMAAVRGRAAVGDAVAVRGAASARLTQHLLESPGHRWRATDLAHDDGHTTVATASRLLNELLRLGLCAVTAERQSRWYELLDPDLLLQWLADRTPPLDRRATLEGYVRARTADHLLSYLQDRVAGQAGVVFTGSAAAMIDDHHIATSLPVAMLRVTPSLDLTDVARMMRLDVGGPGANVRLVADRGLVGTAKPRDVGGVALAGVVRTWLDIRQERRGLEAANLYYDVVLRATGGVGVRR